MNILKLFGIKPKTKQPKQADLPKLPKGYMWRKINGEYHQVCDTCGGNCGQCGDTGRLGNIPFDFDHLIEKTGANKPGWRFNR